jgi:transposase
MKLTRSYNLRIYPNFHKNEEVRYTVSRYKLYLQHFITHLYFSDKKFLSTEGMGTVANQAQKQAIGIIQGERESVKTTEIQKSNIPQIRSGICPGKLEKAVNTSFDFWISVSSPFGGNKPLKLPAKSISPLKQKLKDNWKLSDYSEIFQSKSGIWFVKIFVTKEVEKAAFKEKFLGIDVGIKHSVSRSDNYLGKDLSKIIKIEKRSQSERQRQKHKKKNFKTLIKQQLDIEVKRSLARCRRLNASLAVEHPKTLANLRSGKLHRWARSYFANRITEVAKEYNIFVQWVSPAYTSITCSFCYFIDKRSRVNQKEFKCTCCGFTANADTNASFNIARKGQDLSLKRKNKAPVQSF